MERKREARPHDGVSAYDSAYDADREAFKEEYNRKVGEPYLRKQRERMRKTAEEAEAGYGKKPAAKAAAKPVEVKAATKPAKPAPKPAKESAPKQSAPRLVRVAETKPAAKAPVAKATKPAEAKPAAKKAVAKAKRRAPKRTARLSADRGGIGKGKLESLRESSKAAPEGKIDMGGDEKVTVPSSKRYEVRGPGTESASQTPASKKKSKLRRAFSAVGRGLKRAVTDGPSKGSTQKTAVAKR